jgi:hypothetical protein
VHQLVIFTARCALSAAWGAGALLAQHSFVVTPGKSFGPIRETTSRTLLTRIFGPSAVEDGEVLLPEAVCTFGTVVYIDTKNAIEIGWKDQARTRVAFVRTRWDSLGQWTTPSGVRIGTTLRELVRLAGKPVLFSGFGWDYSGQMTWREQGGSLELLLRSHMDKLPASAYGDHLVPSDLPGLNLDKFEVVRLQQVWHDAWEYHDCHG